MYFFFIIILALSNSFDYLDFFFLLIVAGLILYSLLKKKKPSPIENLGFSKIDTLSNGIVKIKGTLKSINYIVSPISETKCIGYSYSQLSYRSKGVGRAKGSIKWRTYRTKSKSEDFYIQDHTGKIKINAKDISIQTHVNRKEKKVSKTLIDVENLLLEDDTEYILTGSVHENKNGGLEIAKGTRNLIIMDKAFYELIVEDIPFIKKKIRSFIILLILGIIGLVIYKSFVM